MNKSVKDSITDHEVLFMKPNGLSMSSLFKTPNSIRQQTVPSKRDSQNYIYARIIAILITF